MSLNKKGDKTDQAWLVKFHAKLYRKPLLAKLDHYGIRGPALALIKSFLIRKQIFNIDGASKPYHMMLHRRNTGTTFIFVIH